MGYWQCSNKKCPSVCMVYGSMHVKQFDGNMFDFDPIRPSSTSESTCGFALIQVSVWTFCDGVLFQHFVSTVSVIVS